MKRISFQQIAALVATGLILGVSASEVLVGFGNPFPASPSSLALTLFVIGIGVYAASIPIARYRKVREQGNIAKRPNPFVAVRILAFARASLITGAGFFGWHLGLILWLWLFGSLIENLVFPSLLGAASSIALLTASYLAELNCRAPKDSDGEAQG
jgi:hypothetical protein